MSDLKNQEIPLVEKALRHLLVSPKLILKRESDKEGVHIFLNNKDLGTIQRDDEDEEISYDAVILVPKKDILETKNQSDLNPSKNEILQLTLRSLLASPSLEVKNPEGYGSSTEIFVNNIMVGTVFEDDENETTAYDVNISVLLDDFS